MNRDHSEDAVSRLGKLAAELEQVYPQAGDRIAEAIAPVDAAIRKIGVSLNYCHYAESVREDIRRRVDPGEYYAHPYRFASDEDSAGRTTDYALCAARGPDRQCGLCVSACTYQEYDDEYEDTDGTIRTRPAITVETRLVEPAELPLPIRVRILDVLDRFADAYEKHVRKERKNLLNGSVVPKPSE